MKTTAVKRVGPKASELSLGDYLRWLATTLATDPRVVDELNARADAADDQLAALKAIADAEQIQLDGGMPPYGREDRLRAARAAIAKAQPAKKGGGHG